MTLTPFSYSIDPFHLAFYFSHETSMIEAEKNRMIEATLALGIMGLHLSKNVGKVFNFVFSINIQIVFLSLLNGESKTIKFNSF